MEQTLAELVLSRRMCTVRNPRNDAVFVISFHPNRYGLSAYDITDTRSNGRTGILLSPEQVRDWCEGLALVSVD